MWVGDVRLLGGTVVNGDFEVPHNDRWGLLQVGLDFSLELAKHGLFTGPSRFAF